MPPSASAIAAPPRPILLLLEDDDIEVSENDDQFEIIAGEKVEMSPAAAVHGKFAMRLGSRLDAFVTERDLGIVFAAETGFRLRQSPESILAPDVAFVRADRLPPEEEWQGYLPLAPDLVVEVISPSDSAARVLRKVLIYLEAGTRLVITVYPGEQAAVVFGPDGTARLLTIADTLDGGDVLPGFRLPLADLFA